MLACLPILLFLFGISIPFSSDPHSLPVPIGVPFRHCPLRLTLLPPFSTLSAFQPSNSLSSLNAFSLSSLNSRSARRTDSWLSESLDCSSSMVLRSFSTLSRDRVISSCSCALILSRRSICCCRSLTVRSTLRTERWD
jgi:hypothetical protein